jgi:hypothetical protein
LLTNWYRILDKIAKALFGSSPNASGGSSTEITGRKSSRKKRNKRTDNGNNDKDDAEEDNKEEEEDTEFTGEVEAGNRIATDGKDRVQSKSRSKQEQTSNPDLDSKPTKRNARG